MRVKHGVAKTVAAIAAALSVFGGSAAAEGAYPDRMVRMVVPFSAGSITDGVARVLVDKLASLWNQQVIVENRPGLPGTASVANAAPDGYTLMLTSNGHVITKLFNSDVKFDPVKSFVGIDKIAAITYLAVVPLESPVKSMADFLALAKQNPHKLNFASIGTGSAPHLCFELLKDLTKIDVVSVPYKGGPEGITAVLRNDVQLSLSPFPLAQKMAEANKVRVIAVNSTARNPQMPDVPTITEGVPGYHCDTWMAILAPAGTPPAVVHKANEDITKILRMPDVIAKLQTYGSSPSPSTPEALDRQISSEAELYARVLRAAGVIGDGKAK
jgi:tripartite-type tricarboxylate transporter receptor subunit TctC